VCESALALDPAKALAESRDSAMTTFDLWGFLRTISAENALHTKMGQNTRGSRP